MKRNYLARTALIAALMSFLPAQSEALQIPAAQPMAGFDDPIVLARHVGVRRARGRRASRRRQYQSQRLM